MKTKAVVFDFDGTLTIGRANNVWKMLYIALGYDIGEGSNYKNSFLSFKNKEYDYASWVEVNKSDFIKAGLNKTIFNNVLTEINLIRGLEKTLKTLSEKGIKLFVLSGNIKYAIKSEIGLIINKLEPKYFNVFFNAMLMVSAPVVFVKLSQT